jgi:hypothetical protein
VCLRNKPDKTSFNIIQLEFELYDLKCPTAGMKESTFFFFCGGGRLNSGPCRRSTT